MPMVCPGLGVQTFSLGCQPGHSHSTCAHVCAYAWLCGLGVTCGPMRWCLCPQEFLESGSCMCLPASGRDGGPASLLESPLQPPPGRPSPSPAASSPSQGPPPRPPSLSQLPSTAVFAIFGHSAPVGGGAGLTSPREGGATAWMRGGRHTWGRQESCFEKSEAAQAPHVLGPCC